MHPEHNSADKKKSENPNDQIISYYTLRILIGATGVLLPLLVFFGKYISQGSGVLVFSISDYYDNGTAGEILVGVLFVLGFFLLSIKGLSPLITGQLMWAAWLHWEWPCFLLLIALPAGYITCILFLPCYFFLSLSSSLFICSEKQTRPKQ